MDILGIGFAELVFVFIIAMMVFGPRRLPEIAAKAGKFVADLRNMSQGLLAEWQREIAVAGRLEELQQARRDIEAIKQDLAQAKEELGQAQKDVVTTTKTVSSDLKAVSSDLKTVPSELAAAASSSSQKLDTAVKPEGAQPEKAAEAKVEDETHSIQPPIEADGEAQTAESQQPVAGTIPANGMPPEVQQEETTPEPAPAQESPAAKSAPATEAPPVEPPQTDIHPKAEDSNHRHEASAAQATGADDLSANSAVDTTNGAAPASAEASEPAVDVKKKEVVNE